MLQPAADIVVGRDVMTVDLRSLNSPLLGKALTSTSKDLDGVLYKRGEVNKSWKQRVFVLDGGARAVYYFRDKKPNEAALGFVPLWDARCQVEAAAPSSPRPGRGPRSQLTVAAPFRRTFVLGFGDDSTRDQFKAAVAKVRTAGRAADALATNAWWRNNISKTGEDRCAWGRFSGAVSRSLKVRLSLEAEAALCYLLRALHRNDTKETPPVDVVTLASLVEFAFLFGSLVEALEKLDGVLLSLTACSMLYAENMVASGKPGTFVLYVASRPTPESLAVLGLVFVNGRNKVVHKYVFRDPVSKRFYTDVKEPAYESLDHLVATMIGVEETFARQTRLKLDEMERIKTMVLHEQKIKTELSLSLSWAGKLSVQDGSTASPKSPRQAPRSAPLTPKVERVHGPVFDEIEKLLEGGQSSSSSSPRSVSPTAQALEMLSGDMDEHDTSEMIFNNLYCISCGAELSSAGKKFATCDDCGALAVARGDDVQWQPNAAATAAQDAAAATGGAAVEGQDISYRFVRSETLSAEDAALLHRKETSRKETLLGLSTSLQSWSDDMTRSFPKTK